MKWHPSRPLVSVRSPVSRLLFSNMAFSRKHCLFHWQLLGNAWVFLTRFPFPFKIRYSPRLLNLATVYFPVVGFLLGLVGCGLFAAAHGIFNSPVLAIMLMMALAIYSTGAFHEDGFADCCDALGGGYSKEQILAIMRDSRLGTYGTVGLVALLAIKVAALSLIALHDAALFFGIYVFAQTFSRWLPLLMIYRMHYVRLEGKAKPVAEGISSFGLMISFMFIALLLVILWLYFELALSAWLAVLFSGVAGAWWIARKLQHALGGYTGDGLGAAQQLSEVVMYLSLVALF